MDGEQNAAQGQAEGAQNQQTNAEPTEGQQGAATQEDEGADKAAEAYKAALAERDAKIAELKKTIAEAAKTADAAEKLRAEMDALREAGDAQRVEFELMLAGARNVTAARALLGEYDGDVEKLKASEPWLFEGAAAQSGATGLEPAGAAGGGEEADVKRWREIAGLEE